MNVVPFIARWDGGADQAAIKIVPLGDVGGAALAESHFGFGVLTFRVPALFRTEPEYDLWVTGPVNCPKDGIQPLTGVVETDWAAATFTMNWKFTRSDVSIFFGAGEPFSMIFPLARGFVETVRPEFCELGEDKDLLRRFKTWSNSRENFNAGLKIKGSTARKEKWQKDYFRGRIEDLYAPDTHRTKLHLREFR